MTTFTVKVTPKASSNQIIGWKEEMLAVRIKGVPEKGQVNEELVSFLSKVLKVSKSHIAIVSGHTSRIKRIKIDTDVDLSLFK